MSDLVEIILLEPPMDPEQSCVVTIECNRPYRVTRRDLYSLPFLDAPSGRITLHATQSGAPRWLQGITVHGTLRTVTSDLIATAHRVARAAVDPKEGPVVLTIDRRSDGAWNIRAVQIDTSAGPKELYESTANTPELALMNMTDLIRTRAQQHAESLGKQLEKARGILRLMSGDDE